MKSRGCMSDAFPPSWLVPSRGAQETQLTKAKPTSESTMFVGNNNKNINMPPYDLVFQQCFTTTKAHPTRHTSKSPTLFFVGAISRRCHVLQ